MKQFRKTSLLLLALLVLGATYFTSCGRDEDPVTPPTPPPAFGNDTIDLTKGFVFDKSHSSSLWETPYVGAGGLLTGRFNSFGINNFFFDEDEPSKTTFTGWVKLNTVNTGEPGRDTSCLLKTYGVYGTPDSTTNYALLIAKKVEFGSKSKEYIATCDLVFHGVTSEVKAKMVYTGKTHYEAGQVGTKAIDIAGITLTFSFPAKSVHTIVSSSIADQVDIRINTSFKRSF